MYETKYDSWYNIIQWLKAQKVSLAYGPFTYAKINN